MRLEVCANSFQSAKNAELAGAHRIELCQALDVGGLTPSYGLIKTVLQSIDIQLYVLIRPRSGDFYYSIPEFEQMKTNIRIAKELGCHGIVSGVLNQDCTIDLKRTKQLVDLAKPLPFTFHRAFDCVPNPLQALNDLLELDIDRLLTSGQQDTALQGLPLLKQLKRLANKQMIIMPGSGIDAHNAAAFNNEGFKEIHASASVTLSQVETRFKIPQTVSSLGKIKEILKQISQKN